MPDSFKDLEDWQAIIIEMEREKKMALAKPGYLLDPYTFPPVLSQQAQKAPPVITLDPTALVQRLIGHGKFQVQHHVEVWGAGGQTQILHIAVRTNDGQVIRFEEDPDKFPSDDLINRLRLLR